MTVSRRLRFEILRRDNHTCRYCGAAAPDATLTVDHVIPVALGGGDEPNNLVTACQNCNAGKSSTSPDAPIVEDVDAAALLWAKAIERANAIRNQEIGDRDALLREFFAEWMEYGGSWDEPNGNWGMVTNWSSTIERFLENGLTVPQLKDMVSVAMSNQSIRSRNVWRYFCGIAWNEIGRRQELARRLIEDGEV